MELTHFSSEEFNFASFALSSSIASDPRLELVNKLWIKKVFRFCALLSFISVCANTTRTFEYFPILRYATFIMDVLCLIFLTLEMIGKIQLRGFIHGESAYLKDRWCQFDASMVLCLFNSIVLQIFEMTHVVSSYSYFSMLRCPRPLILIKVIRSCLRFRIPKSRINLILQRSSSQIYNVTLFFLFFMCLYGLVGVQFFGELTYHCVANNTDPENPQIENLMIPDTYCSKDSSGYKCPAGTKCISIKVKRNQRGYNGFDEIATSFFTVYEAASQEGWVFLMYRAIDSLASWRPIFYFITMIFFLAWLVKNVFVAVITETFAEIRVQFQQMWGARAHATDLEAAKVLVKTDDGLRLVDVDENKRMGYFASFFSRILWSPIFNAAIIILILANAAVTATIHYTHNEEIDRRNRYTYRCIEIAFTVLFNLEAVLKITCLGVKNYLKRSTYKFELALCIGTTLHCFDVFYRTKLTCFQVMRVVRLLKCSPLLEDFANKVFGPGKKLGSLIIFTAVLLLVTSAVSMQLFCFIEGLDKFEIFPKAFMSMFQVLTQKGWVEVMHQTMIKSKSLAILIAFYFILYHLFFSLIVLSMFVAVILDNLELDEDVKKIKQLKMREESAQATQKLPWRLRIFEKFSDHPQMVTISKVADDFVTPKIRESFMRQFVDQEDSYLYAIGTGQSPSSPIKLNIMCSPKIKRENENMKRIAVSNIVGHSQNLRLLVCDGPTDFKSSLLAQQHKVRFDRRSTSRRSGTNVKKLPVIRENGDVLDNSKSPQHDDYDIKAFQYKKQQAEFKRSQQEEELRENHPFFDTPLFTVGRDSRFRKFCQTIVEARYQPTFKDPVTGHEIKLRYKTFHKLLALVSYLEWVMILVTAMSCVSMMFETPRNRLVEQPLLQIAEFTFVICMSVEMTLKIFANGLLFTPKALIKDFGGILELFIYTVSIVFLCWLPASVPPNSGAQVLMILRCLRPLRIFVLVPDLRKVVFELLRGSKEIILVAVLLASLLFMFGIYGVQIYGGKLAVCNDRSITKKEECVGSYIRQIEVTRLILDGAPPAILVPRVWANPHNFNFDGIGSAMLALFEVLSLEGWLEIRDVIINKMGASHGIFVHVFVFVGTLIGLTLFVGVVIANYNENKGTALLTVDQRRWLDLKGRIRLAQPIHLPPRPKNSYFRALIFDITQNKIFKRASVVLVILNCALLAVPWKSELTATTKSLAAVSSVFTLIFLIEAAMKAIAFGISGYWQSKRNRFEFCVTVLSLIWAFVNILSYKFIALQDLSNKFGYTVIIMRLFTICGKHATLNMLMLTILASFYKSFFIIFGMFLLMLVYAFSGVILFGCVKYGSQLDRHANFKNAPKAMLLLLRIITGEDWNKIMHDCMIAPPFCTTAPNYWQSDCGNFVAAVLYFCSFYIIITYIVLNLLLAIIMENFSLFYSNEEDALLSHTDVRHFQTVWNLVDINRKGMIPARRVKFLLRLLKGRLEVDLEKDRLLFKHMCYEIEKLNNGGDVTFHDVLNMLSYRSVDIRKALQFDELVAREELEMLIEEEVAKQTIRNWLSNCIRRMRAKEQSGPSKAVPKASEISYMRDNQPSITDMKKSVDEEKRSKEEKLRSAMRKRARTQPTVESMKRTSILDTVNTEKSASFRSVESEKVIWKKWLNPDSKSKQEMLNWWKLISE